MFHLVHKNGNGGGKNFCTLGYDTYDSAVTAAQEALHNSAITEVMIVEAKARVQRTMNVEVTKL